MTHYSDFLLLLVVLLNLYVLATSRMASAIRAVAAQGALLSVLPLVLGSGDGFGRVVHLLGIALGTLAIKALLMPWLLLRAMRKVEVRREVEPFVSLHVSVVLGAVLTVIAFWVAGALQLPRPTPSTLLVPVALATLLIGFLVCVSRRKAISQVLGYLMLENGVYIFGQCLTQEMPFVVDLGILLDLLVGVFVMGIAIHHIRREFDDIDTDALSTLTD